MDEFNQLLEIALTQGLIVLSAEIKCFRDTGAAECCKKGPLDLFGYKRWANCEVVCHHEAVIVLWKVRKRESIEDFVRERGNDGWFCQIFNGSLDVKLAIAGPIPH